MAHKLSSRKTRKKNLLEGGQVSGPGSETSDSVVAQVPANGYVVPADTAQALGPRSLASTIAATHQPGQAPGVTARVSNNEVVLPPDTANAIGRGNLDSARAMTHRFADGGMVEYPDVTNPVARWGIDHAARGVGMANQVGKREQPMTDLPFALADTTAGLAAMGMAGVYDGVKNIGASFANRAYANGGRLPRYDEGGGIGADGPYDPAKMYYKHYTPGTHIGSPLSIGAQQPNTTPPDLRDTDLTPAERSAVTSAASNTTMPDVVQGLSDFASAITPRTQANPGGFSLATAQPAAPVAPATPTTAPAMPSMPSATQPIGNADSMAAHLDVPREASTAVFTPSSAGVTGPPSPPAPPVKPDAPYTGMTTEESNAFYGAQNAMHRASQRDVQERFLERQHQEAAAQAAAPGYREREMAASAARVASFHARNAATDIASGITRGTPATIAALQALREQATQAVGHSQSLHSLAGQAYIPSNFAGNEALAQASGTGALNQLATQQHLAQQKQMNPLALQSAQQSLEHSAQMHPLAVQSAQQGIETGKLSLEHSAQMNTLRAKAINEPDPTKRAQYAAQYNELVTNKPYNPMQFHTIGGGVDPKSMQALPQELFVSPGPGQTPYTVGYGTGATQLSFGAQAAGPPKEWMDAARKANPKYSDEQLAAQYKGR